ncbi:MAG: hypothetical protein KKG21_05760, partial [Candidatus Omnitrophica bacterium]|nr:hypothetical protein [Candidatus Omnitrophota bacterium]
IVTSVYPLDEQRRAIPEAESYHDKSQGSEALLAKVRSLLEDSAANKNSRQRNMEQAIKISGLEKGEREA